MPTDKNIKEEQETLLHFLRGAYGYGAQGDECHILYKEAEAWLTELLARRNTMTPDKVEEIVGFIYRANKSMYNSPEAKEADLRRFITTTLTQYHQDMMSEVVEKLEKAKRANVLIETETGQVNCYDCKSLPKSPFCRHAQGWNDAFTHAQTIIKSLEHQDMSELDQDCPYCDIHSSCSIHADNQK